MQRILNHKFSMKFKKTKVFRLPAYTTILSQAFSPDGNYLAVGSDFGRIAIFKVSNLVSEGRSQKENSQSVDKIPGLSCFMVKFSSSN